MPLVLVLGMRVRVWFGGKPIGNGAYDADCEDLTDADTYHAARGGDREMPLDPIPTGMASGIN
jgi:hypothetical protein